MRLFNRKSRVEKISLVLDRDSSIYDDYEEKTNKKWQKDLDKVFKGMKKNGTPDELKEFLAYRYPFHCWEYGLEDMKEIIWNVKEITPYLTKSGHIPTRIGELINLEALDLAYRSIDTVPEEISKLQNLKTLILGGNPINYFPDSITKLTNLEELLMGGFHLEEVPETIKNLKNLKTLHLINVGYESFPNAITCLENLRELDLMGNKITEIPSTIEKLIKLRELSLIRNPIKRVPTEIKHLKELNHLYLKGTNLSDTVKSHIKKLLPNAITTF
ncbi:leucine-rich repeat domain-containing protein [uncultured Microscilla sp.]|uniref:leucine-rich repeat domain-containing protein n=1 Tax=uncultured Microscilla sp. TaxID=432653 RepID=UPI00261D3FDD|nr:leucine-rich repeat domain-containing protein [uncultured Microscilla sp.]